METRNLCQKEYSHSVKVFLSSPKFTKKKFRLIYLKKSSSQYFLFVCSVHLTSRDKSRDAASYLASKFLTRPDTRDTSLPAFLDWALVTATKGNIRSKLISGIRMIDLITLIDWEIKVFLISFLILIFINMNYPICFTRWGPGT